MHVIWLYLINKIKHKLIKEILCDKLIWNYYGQVQKITRITVMDRGAQILGGRLQWRLDFVRWRPVFVDPQYGNGFLTRI